MVHFTCLTVVSYSISTSNHNNVDLLLDCQWVVSYSISTSNHNYQSLSNSARRVVSYSISTSNHNNNFFYIFYIKLYLIPFLHQTTTIFVLAQAPSRCILFHFYIKPQLLHTIKILFGGCILFHFYIKPQQNDMAKSFRLCCILFHFYIKPQLTRI